MNYKIALEMFYIYATQFTVKYLDRILDYFFLINKDGWTS